jgi:mannose/fructose/N-acetylgalactosamine-specific phosphotransferase system component IIC
MRSHVNLLGMLQLAWGAMGLLLGGSLLLLAAGAAAIARASPGDPLTAALTALVFVVFAGALVASGCANAWAGQALQRHRPPARLATLALAVINLFVLPFGTALAIYAFWVLLNNDARALFEARTAA